MSGTNGSTLVEARDLSTWFTAKAAFYGSRRGTIRAVDKVNLDILKGEVLGLVGESGSGKTTLGRTLLFLDKPTAGSVRFESRDLRRLRKGALRALREKMQIIYQDPYGSLEARMKVGHIISEGLDIHRIGTRADRRQRVKELLTVVGLLPEYAERYPHEFSGGQRQRISIARALALNPDFLVADEPVSALDVSVRAQIINLLMDLQERFHLTMLFISHDLSVVEHISDRVAVMYLGRLMEIAPREEMFHDPRHPYTQALMNAVPKPDPHNRAGFTVLPGDIPSPMNPPSGCVFRTRCPMAVGECAREVPPLRERDPGHLVACIRT